MKIKFKTKKELCITRCPYKVSILKPHIIRTVGGIGCGRCKHFGYRIKGEKIIECYYGERITNKIVFDKYSRIKIAMEV